MEAAAAWDGACQFQLANWTAVQEPATGFPVEYASIDIPGSCSIQSYEYDDVQLQQHLVEYYSAASQHNNIATSEKAEVSNDDSDDKVMDKFHADMRIMKKKMHRYPACLGSDIDKSYIVPRIVALGPYHHGLEHLKEAEEVKRVAACHCTREGQSVEEMRREFILVCPDVRRFYDKDAIAGISDDEFQRMMFYDACFLVQYMALWCRSSRREKKDVMSLKAFMRPKRNDIFHDVMLLENQLPWSVVDTVLGLMDASWISKEFVARWRYCMMPYHYREGPPRKPFIWYEDYTPSHLLDLLRHYIVGRRTDIDDGISHIKPGAKKPKNMSFSVSAMDLAEIGIKLKANESLELIDIRLNPKGTFFPELCLAPLSLDRDSASYLINMAALELCTVESFGAATEADSAVCSYLLLLANLVCREEEVQELRERRLLQRGGGLTNAEVLAFLSCFQVLRMGPLFHRIMAGIEEYREESPMMKTELHAFFHNHWKIMVKVGTGFGALLGIIGTLVSIKKAI